MDDYSKLRVFGLDMGVGSVRVPKIGVVGSFGIEIVGGEDTWIEGCYRAEVCMIMDLDLEPLSESMKPRGDS